MQNLRTIPSAFTNGFCLAVLLFLGDPRGWAVENRLGKVAAAHIEQAAGEPVQFLVRGKHLELPKDANEVAAYFADRPPDPLLVGRMRLFQTESAAKRGVALRAGEIGLSVFNNTPFPSDPTWTENPFHDNNWVFKLHSLILVQYLLAAHSATGDDSYLKSACAFVQDWIEDNTRAEAPSPFSWNDHSTALRLENLLYLFEYARTHHAGADVLVPLLRSIHLHCSILADPGFYVKHHNHGLDRSYRLYWAGATLPEFANAATWEGSGAQPHGGRAVVCALRGGGAGGKTRRPTTSDTSSLWHRSPSSLPIMIKSRC